jgi:hypothetical protein
MAKWIKNVSGSSQNILGTPTANNAFYQVVDSKLHAASENTDIINKVASGDYQMSEDGVAVITDTATGLQFLYGVQTPVDSDGAPLSHTKMFKTGSRAQNHNIEFRVGVDATLIHKKADGNTHSAGTNYGWATMEMYDSSGTVTTDSAQAVKTCVEWEPPSIDYEIIGGYLYQASQPSNDIYVYAIGVPDLTEAQGGSIPFCNQANLKILPTSPYAPAVHVDGRVAKSMNYDATYHTSKFHFVFFHPVSTDHKLMLKLEIAI